MDDNDTEPFRNVRDKEEFIEVRSVTQAVNTMLCSKTTTVVTHIFDPVVTPATGVSENWTLEDLRGKSLFSQLQAG